MKFGIGELQRFVRQQRDLVRKVVGATLSLDQATAMIVDVNGQAVARTIRVLHANWPNEPPLDLISTDKESVALGHPAADMWLIQICVDHYLFDGLPLCERLRYRFPHAVIIGRSVDASPRQPGAVHLAGADYVVGTDDVDVELPIIVRSCWLRRRYLLDTLVEAEVSERVTEKFGPDAARLAGLRAPQQTTIKVSELRDQMYRSALARSDGNRSAAARLLGVNRSTVHRWLKRNPPKD